jgi:hypothetical protein
MAGVTRQVKRPEFRLTFGFWDKKMKLNHYSPKKSLTEEIT